MPQAGPRPPTHRRPPFTTITTTAAVAAAWSPRTAPWSARSSHPPEIPRDARSRASRFFCPGRGYTLPAMADATYPDLRAFLDQLRRDGDLATVEAPVDAHLEAAEIHRRVIAAGGPALLFTNVKDRDFPLATNL